VTGWCERGWRSSSRPGRTPTTPARLPRRRTTGAEPVLGVRRPRWPCTRGIDTAAASATPAPALPQGSLGHALDARPTHGRPEPGGHPWAAPPRHSKGTIPAAPRRTSASRRTRT
jgi:hypothetical protein